MNTIKTAWKAFVKENDPTAEDMAAYHILRAVVSKSNDKFAVAKALMDRAFTPISNNTKLANGAAPYYGAYTAIRVSSYSAFWKIGLAELTDLQKTIYPEIYGLLVEEFRYGFEKHEPEYMFFFVRQDISPEQQLVQTAHAAMVSGTKLNSIHDPNKLYFCIIGVENEEALEEARSLIERNAYGVGDFREPDLGNTVTAIYAGPIKRHKKGFLSNYKTLKFAN